VPFHHQSCSVRVQLDEADVRNKIGPSASLETIGVRIECATGRV
jgi:hypothetical protein